MAILIGTVDMTGGSNSPFFAGDMGATKYVALDTGSVELLKLGCRDSTYTQLILGVFADNAGAPGALLGTTEAITDNDSVLVSADMVTPVEITEGTSYWLAALPLGGTLNMTGAVGNPGFVGLSVVGTSLPDPFGTPGFNDSSIGLAIQGEGTAGPSGPANTVAPAVTGTTQTGQTLSCSTGTWTGSPTGYAYQWKRGASNISGATSSTYLLDVADEGQAVKCVVTATNAGGSTSHDSNTVTPTAPPALDFTIRLTGGSSNADPLLSLGGAESSHEAGNDIFDDIPHAIGVTGQTDYRRQSLRNGDGALSGSAKAWFLELDVEDGVTIAIGACTTSAGSTIPTIANKTTAPSGTTFSTPMTEGAAVDLGTIGPGQGKGLDWRRIIAAGTGAVPAYSGILRIKVTPL